MSSFKAIILMIIWTGIVAFGLYEINAHENFREPVWAVGTGLALLITHLVNLGIYFKVAGEKPYEWNV